MEIEQTSMEGLFLIKPKIHFDERGYFFESFKNDFWKKYLPKTNFIQENESKSSYGTLRGLHFQTYPYTQSKLVRVIKGKVQDVVVDLRKSSKTFGHWESFILSDENKFQLLVPRGFAHGFLTLSKEAIFTYKVDNEYCKESEDGIHFKDSRLNINWLMKDEEICISEKDSRLNFDIDRYSIESNLVF